MTRRAIRALVRFVAEEDGPTAVEYAIMLAFIIMVCVGAISTLGQKVNSQFTNPTLVSAVGN